MKRKQCGELDHREKSNEGNTNPNPNSKLPTGPCPVHGPVNCQVEFPDSDDDDYHDEHENKLKFAESSTKSSESEDKVVKSGENFQLQFYIR